MEKYLIPVAVVIVGLLIYHMVLPKLGIKLGYEQQNFEAYEENFNRL